MQQKLGLGAGRFCLYDFISADCLMTGSHCFPAPFWEPKTGLGIGNPSAAITKPFVVVVGVVNAATNPTPSMRRRIDKTNNRCTNDRPIICQSMPLHCPIPGDSETHQRDLTWARPPGFLLPSAPCKRS